MVRFPTDGSPLSLAASDTQIERASIGELDVAKGAVRSGGQLTLASGVTAPPSPPELTTGWQKSTTLTRPDVALSYDWIGLAYWDSGPGYWVRAVNALGSAGDAHDSVEVYNLDGTLHTSFHVTLNPRYGITVIGDVVYVFGPNHEKNSFYPYYIDGYDLNTGEKVSWHGYSRTVQARSALGNDGTNLLVASIYNNELWVHRRNPVTGEQVGSDMRSGSNSWPASGSKDLYGVRINGNDVGVVTGWGERVYLNSNNVLVRKTDAANASGYAGWVLPAHDVSGCVWVSGVPYPVDSNGAVYTGSSFTSDVTVQACFTWTNGTHETTPSPVADVRVPSRESVVISLPARAGLQKRLYLKSSQGGGAWRRTTVPETTTSVLISEILAGLNTLPTTNTFPNADPATLKSTNDKFEVKGDGSGKWGPLTFNADGTMTGIRKTASGTLDITPTAANTPREVWVTFPEGRFTAPPTVVVSARTTVPGTRVTGVGSGGQTASGFYAYLTRTDTTATGFNWVAMEEG